MLVVPGGVSFFFLIHTGLILCNLQQKLARKQQKPYPEPKAKKRTEKAEPKPWGWKNQVGKQFTEQSKRDPFYAVRQAEKQERMNARKEQLLKQVKYPTPNLLKQVVQPNARFKFREIL